MKTELTELLDIKYPIIQGAMAWLADPDLASAVSNAGGLGVVGTAGDSVDQIRQKVQAMHEKTDQPFAMNLYLLNDNIDDVVDYLASESGVKIVTTGAGNPGKYMDQLKEAGIKVIPVVASVALAKRMDRIGADAVVVEGMEAGGHIGRSTTMALLPQVVDAVNCPVIAAGGFGDGRALAAGLMLGAAGIQVGTRFAVAKECNAHENFKKAIIKASDISTTITGNITGHPIRVLRNNLTKDYLAVEKALTSQEDPDLTELDHIASGSLKRAVVDGDVKQGSVMAGQIAGLIAEEQSCQEILEDYVQGAQVAYQSQAAVFSEDK